MKFYLTYLNYDNSEYYLWSVATALKDAKKHYREVDLPSFLTSGQPDISHLYLIKTSLDDRDSMSINTAGASEQDIERILKKIEEDPSTQYIYDVDGEINYDFVKYYGLNFKDIDPDEFEDEFLEIAEELDALMTSDPDTYNNIVARFIKQHLGY